MGAARDHASKSLLWSGIDTFSQTGFSILALVLLARVLSVEDMGEGALVIMIVQLVAMPFELLFHDALIQRQDLQERHLSSAFAATLLGALCAALVLALAAPWLAALYNKPALEVLLPAAVIAIPASGITAVLGAILRRNLAFAPLARRTLIGRLSGVVLGVVVALMGGGAWALVVMYVASLVLSTAVLMVVSDGMPKLRCEFTALRELLSFGAPNMLAQLFLLGNGRLFVTLSGFYLSEAALGQLSLAFRVVEELRNTLSSAAAQLALPLLTRRAQLPAQFAMVFGEATCFTAGVLLPLYAGVAVTADDLMAVVFGVKWQAAAPIVQVFALAAMLLTLRQYSSIAINALGRPGVNAVINSVAFAFSLILLVDGLGESVEMTAQIWIWRAVLLLVGSFIGMRMVAAFSVRAQLQPVAAPLLAALVMAVSLILLRHTPLMAGSLADLNEVRLLLSIGIGVVVYFLALLAVSPQLLRRAFEFARAALMRNHGQLTPQNTQ
ncbi:MAG: oligosaccharide flippase family protein [Steroidobacteraceae bacterium]